MFLRRSRLFSGSLVAFLAFALTLTAPLGSHAQDSEAEYHLHLLLSGDPKGDIPDRSVSVTVADTTTGDDYGTCWINMTTKPDGCSVPVPAEGSVTAMLDESTLPDGIIVLENPIDFTTPAERTGIGDIWFELAYVESGGESPEEPAVPHAPGDVSDLPGTGSGPLTDATTWAATSIVTTSGIIAIIFGAGALLTRHRHRTR